MSFKPVYETPRAVFLSGLGATGQSPLGYCMDGHEPTTQVCGNGDNVTQHDECSPVGILPELGDCHAGGNVVSGCSFGSIH
jgi:hypothetical protein